MADWNELEDDKHYKSLVIENKSKSDITLYIYSGWAPCCKFSTFSKIIKPDERYRYHEKTSFKFEIVASIKKDLRKPEELKKDTLITINKSLACDTKCLAGIKNERRNELEDDKHNKSLVIENKSKSDITLYIYSGWAPCCKFSTFSKIIKPDESYCYHEKTSFKFEIVASIKSSDDKKTKKDLRKPEELKEDTLITINESLACDTTCFADIVNGRRLLLRKIHRDEELATAAGMSNFYDILGLDMEEVRKMNNEDAKRAIEKAYKKQMLIWHPDRNFGDDEIAKQIIEAKECLMDDGKRADYNNKAYYEKGLFETRWLFIKRLKAIFWSDCYTEEQRKAYHYRMGFFGLSLLFAVGGIALTLATAGAAAPVLVALGAILGAGFTGAGLQSLGHTVSKKSILDHEFDWKSWASKAVIGFFGGALTGGAGVGITAGMVGIGSAALQSGAVTAGQYVGMGAATGAVGGAMSSLFSDIAKASVDKEKVTVGGTILRAVSGGMIGAGAGALGGLVTKGIVDSRASAATPTLEADAVEQVSALTGGRRVANATAHAVARQITVSGTKAMLGVAPKVIEERLDDDVENQKTTKHVQSGFENMAVDVLQNASLNTAGGLIGHSIKESALDEQSYSRNATTSNESKAEIYANSNEAHENNQGLGNVSNDDQGAGEEKSEPSNETNEEQKDNEPEGKMLSKQSLFQQNGIGKLGTCAHNMVSKQSFFQQNETGEPEDLGRSHTTIEKSAPDPEDQCHEEHCRSTQQDPHVFSEESKANQSSNGKFYEENRKQSDETNKKEKEDKPHEVMIKYRSEGAWVSKMIVTFNLNGKEDKKEVSGDGKRVYIPVDATNVEVGFQVSRPHWGHIKKYDRFKKKWSDTPHTFRYEKPTDRTFTISGPLWWEAVTRVSNEHHEETKEMS